MVQQPTTCLSPKPERELDLLFWRALAAQTCKAAGKRYRAPTEAEHKANRVYVVYCKVSDRARWTRTTAVRCAHSSKVLETRNNKRTTDEVVLCYAWCCALVRILSLLFFLSHKRGERERLQCFCQPTSLIAFASKPCHIFRKSRQSRIKLKTCM